MSKSKKIAIWVAVSLIGIGGILVLIAMVAVGFNFNKFSTMKFETKTYEVTESFVNIKAVDTESGIHFLPSTDGKCRVVCQDSEKLIHNVQVENQTLGITRTDNRSWYEQIGIYGGDDFRVTVYLPEQEYESLYIQSVSGDIEIPKEFSFTNAELITTSGVIVFRGTIKEKISAKSTSGDVFVKNMIAGTAKVETTSGEIVLEDMALDSLTASTTSGDIEVSSVQANGEVYLKAVSGDVELKNVDGGSFSIKTTSGDVEGNLLSDKNFVTDTTSGNVRVPKSDSFAGICEIKTTSGNIEIEISP